MPDTMAALQRKNLAEIEGLNQRGGRTLSFVDLIRAHTLDPELVAYCWAAIARGASFLTAARPGGAGKSTLLANLLVLLPPHEEIITHTDPRLTDPQARPCSLAHEIGAGHWYGYLWGPEVRRFAALAEAGHRLAGCLHADTLGELTEILQAPPLSLTSAEIRCFGLLLFIHVLPDRQRRVVALHEAGPEGTRQVFRWDASSDEFVREGGSVPDADYQQRLADVRKIVAGGQEQLEAVRAQVLACYAGA